jgi:tripartite-type tricarboxylate transporter receptor subunit TctC
LGLKPNLVAYRGTGPALNDVIGGHVDFFCEQVVSVQGAIKGGTIKAYAVSGNSRSPALLDVPSAKEVGANAYQINIWSAIFAQRTHKACCRQAQRRAQQGARRSGGGQAAPRSRRHDAAQGDRGPAYLAKLLKADIARWIRS